jgi:hypothetical protein
VTLELFAAILPFLHGFGSISLMPAGVLLEFSAVFADLDAHVASHGLVGIVLTGLFAS